MKIEDEDVYPVCPYCKGKEPNEKGFTKGALMIIKDWTNMHDRETLLHCWDCDRIYLMKYKFESVVELKASPIELEWNKDED